MRYIIIIVIIICFSYHCYLSTHIRFINMALKSACKNFLHKLTVTRMNKKVTSFKKPKYFVTFISYINKLVHLSNASRHLLFEHNLRNKIQFSSIRKYSNN